MQPVRKSSPDTGIRIAMVIVTLTAWLLRSVGLGRLALTGDEAYYVLWGQRLDWAYYDHPAGMGVLARISTTLAGTSEFGVRWLDAVIGTVCVLLVYRVGRQMLSAGTGFLAATALALGAPYVITSRLLTTNPLHLLMTLVSLNLCWDLIKSRPQKTATVEPKPRVQQSIHTALLTGLSLALLVNTKYTAYLFGGALALGILLDYRQHLHRPHLWIAAGIGCLGLLPVLIWNMSHDWASIRWQLGHLASPSPGSEGGTLIGMWLRNLHHGVAYITPPLAAMMTLGILNVRTPARRLLTLIAAALLLPVGLSPANSPRNLTTGAVFLLLLAADRMTAWMTAARHRTKLHIAAAILLMTIAIYGIGSFVTLNAGNANAGPLDTKRIQWPSSSAVPLLLEDAAGWPKIGKALASAPGTLYAIDYSLAGQLRYYTERPAYTAWPQYRLWSIPTFNDVTVVADDHLPISTITQQMDRLFDEVAGPWKIAVSVNNRQKVLWVWVGSELQTDADIFLDSLDFLTLYESLQ